MRSIPLNLLTLYADLQQGVDFPQAGADQEPATVSRRLVGGKRRIYLTTRDGRQRYVGTVGDRVAEATAAGAQRMALIARDRRKTITALKAAGVPAPDAMTGRVIEALAGAGLFDRGTVLIGTTAYQIYPMLVGAVLSTGTLTTLDADLAMTRVAIGQMTRLPAMADILKGVDPTFEARLHRDHKYPFTFMSGSSFVVDVLTTAGRSDGAVLIKGLACGAQPLKYLDYLIEDPVSTVALVGSGVRVKVPQPARYALHKLVVAQKRTPGSPKIPKDILQARELIEALTDRDPRVVEDAIDDVLARGPAWRKLIREGLKMAGVEPHRTP